MRVIDILKELAENRSLAPGAVSHRKDGDYKKQSDSSWTKIPDDPEAYHHWSKNLQHSENVPFHIRALAHQYHAERTPAQRILGRSSLLDQATNEHIKQDKSYQKKAKIPSQPEETDSYEEVDPMSHFEHELAEEQGKTPVASRVAASWYSHNGYKAIHDLLRKGGKNSDADNEAAHEMIPHLDKLTRANRLQKSMVLHRGGAFPKELVRKISKPGHVFKSTDFTSSSGEAYTAEVFADQAMEEAPEGHQKVLFQIEAPKGSHGVPITRYSKYTGELEYLLPRGSKFETRSAERDPDGTHVVKVRLKTPDKAPALPKKTWKIPSGAEMHKMLQDSELAKTLKAKSQQLSDKD